MFDWFQKFLEQNVVTRLLQRTSLNQGQGFTIYDLVVLYIAGISQGIFSTRAAAASWSLFFSIFPFLIFLFQVMPLMPHYDVIESLFYQDLLTNILPAKIQEDVVGEITLIAKKNRGDSFTRLGWKAWLTLIFTVFISTNGISAIITGFNTTYHEGFQSRPFWQQRLIAFLLTILFTALICGVLLVLYYSNSVIRYMSESGTLSNQSDLVGMGLNFLSALTAFFVGLLALYYFAVKVKGGIKSVLPGALLTTFLFVFIFLAFQLYIDKLSSYNLLYGSIGTVMIVMLLIYLVVVLILVGFELNASLADLRSGKTPHSLKAND